MAWPHSQDFNEAIQSPASCFADPDLRQAQPVVNALGLPLPRSGNFADVYELRGAGRSWAVKCFTREIPGLQARYQAISQHLQQCALPFLVEFQFQQQGIRIRNQSYPILKMHWVEGLTLNEFVRQHLDKPAKLETTCQLWLRVAARLREVKIAHGDLQHGNVLFVPGSRENKLSVKLVDYDGMFVPALAASKSGEVGHPNYQHPLRLRDALYDAEVDRFSNLAILTALRALIVHGRNLWDRFDNGDNLLFKEADFRSPGKSALFRELWATSDPVLRVLVGFLALATQQPPTATPLVHELLAESRTPTLTLDQQTQVEAVLGRRADSPVAFTTAAAGARGTTPLTGDLPSPFELDPSSSGSPNLLAVPTARVVSSAKTTMTIPVVPAPPHDGFNGLSEAVGGAPVADRRDYPVARPYSNPFETLADEADALARSRDHRSSSAGMWPALVALVGVAAVIGWVWFSTNGKIVGKDKEVSRDAPAIIGDAVSKDEDSSPPPQPVPSIEPKPDFVGEYAKLTGHLQPVRRARYSSEGFRAVTAAHDGTARLWDLRTGKPIHVFRPHDKKKVEAIAISPDGNLVATAGEDKVIRFWKTSDGKQSHTAPLPSDAVQLIHDIVFSPDGATLACCGERGLLACYHAATGKLAKRFPTPDRPIRALAWSPDGRTLYAASANVSIWDVDNEADRIQFSKHQGLVMHVAVSGDGKRVLSVDDRDDVLLWDSQTLDVVQRFEVRMAEGDKEQRGTVESADLSADGTRVLIAGALRFDLFDAESGKRIQSFPSPGAEPWSVALSTNGTRAMSVSGVETVVHLWALPRPEPPPPPPEEKIEEKIAALEKKIAESPDRFDRESHATLRRLYAGRDDKKAMKHLDVLLRHEPMAPEFVQLLLGEEGGKEAQVARLLRLADEHPDLKFVRAACWLRAAELEGAVKGKPFAERVAALEGADLKEYRELAKRWLPALPPPPPPPPDKKPDLESKLVGEIWKFEGHDAAVHQVAFSPSGKSAVSCGGDKTIRLWDLTTGKEKRKCDAAEHQEVTVAAFTWDGRRLLSGGKDKTVRVWNVEDGKSAEPWTSRLAAGEIHALAVSPVGSRFATGGTGTGAVLWDADRGELRTIGTTADLTAIAFSPRGRFVALASSKENVARIWEAATGREVRVLTGHTQPVKTLAFSPDGRFLATGSEDKTTRLWDVETGIELRRLTGNDGRVNGLVFTPDGRRLLTASADKSIRLWDLAGNLELVRWEAHTAAVASVACSPDGRHALSASDDKTIRLWRLPDPDAVPTPLDLRAIPPPADEIARAERLIREIFRSDYEKKKVAELLALAVKLHAKVSEVKDDDVATRYVLLRETADLSAQAGNTTLAFLAIDETARTFAVDALKLKRAAVEKAAKQPSFRVAEACLALADAAALADRYDDARSLTTLGGNVARQAKNTTLAQRIDARGKTHAEIQKQFEVAQTAARKLRDKPNDVDAASTVGKFLCFFKGDWESGLPYLALCDEPEIKKLAERELARPVNAKDWLELADGWWTARNREPAWAKNQVIARALHWFRIARPFVEGISREQWISRLEELERGAPLAVWEPVGYSLYAADGPIIAHKDIPRELSISPKDGAFRIQGAKVKNQATIDGKELRDFGQAVTWSVPSARSLRARLHLKHAQDGPRHFLHFFPLMETSTDETTGKLLGSPLVSVELKTSPRAKDHYVFLDYDPLTGMLELRLNSESLRAPLSLDPSAPLLVIFAATVREARDRCDTTVSVHAAIEPFTPDRIAPAPGLLDLPLRRRPPDPAP
jgi:WD40 repeat protein